MKVIGKVLGIILTLIIVWNAGGAFEIYRTKLIFGLFALLVGYLIYGSKFLKNEDEP
jgi:hypothetical protein